jgi:TrmH family RNA methyltransferase
MAVGYCPKKLKTTEALKEPRRPLFLVAFNAVNDPQNVGLIARNAAAFGVQALIVDNATYDPYYRKAIRVSMGTIFRLPVYYDYDLKESLSWLKKRYNMRIIAAACGMDSEVIAGTKLSGSVCIVFGNEDKGISREILDIADAKVRIPVSRNVDSLNVACASAVCLYEASRRRRKGHSLIRVTH